MYKIISKQNHKDLLLFFSYFLIAAISTISNNKQDITGNAIAAAILFNLPAFPAGGIWVLFIPFISSFLAAKSVDGEITTLLIGFVYVIISYFQWFIFFSRFHNMIKVRRIFFIGVNAFPLGLIAWKILKPFIMQ